MYLDPFQVSIETLIGAAPMLGQRLEDRSRIRLAQDERLLDAIQAATTMPLRSKSQASLFCVAPLDILVTDHDGRKRFQLIEVNGTGIGGLTNISEAAVSAVLDGFQGLAQTMTHAAPLVLVAVSGKECDGAPRVNRLMHEKVLYAEALRRGFARSGRDAAVVSMPQIADDPRVLAGDRATIVLGYIKDFLARLSVQRGRLLLVGRQVTAAINDRFCLNVVDRFAGRLDLASLSTMNRGFVAGADKSVAYGLLNDYLAVNPLPYLPRRVEFARAADRYSLVHTVLSWVRHGKRTVIKPRGTGLGHGIEFFLSPDEEPMHMISRIDASIRLTQEYYGAQGGAFPYTICEYVDTPTLRQPNSPLHGHKYELRVVVYRDGLELRAFPSIVKVSGEAYDASRPSHGSLINNITASAQKHKADGTEFMLPLTNWETLDLLELRPQDLRDVSAFATSYVRFLLDRLEDRPQVFGLPARRPSVVTVSRAGLAPVAASRQPALR